MGRVIQVKGDLGLHNGEGEKWWPEPRTTYELLPQALGTDGVGPVRDGLGSLATTARRMVAPSLGGGAGLGSRTRAALGHLQFEGSAGGPEARIRWMHPAWRCGSRVRIGQV